MKAIFIWPDIFDRKLLAGHKKFLSEGGLGVVLPCPKWGLQEFMRHAGWTTMRASTQKVLNKELTQDAIVGCIYQCYNIKSHCWKGQKAEKPIHIHHPLWVFLVPISKIDQEAICILHFKGGELYHQLHGIPWVCR
jgi:hypothetical protein